MKKIYVEVDDERRIKGWGTSCISDRSVGVDVHPNHPIFLMQHRFLFTSDGQIIIDTKENLEEPLLLKDQELNHACKEAIMSGFSHVVNGKTYHFSFDMESQSNILLNHRILSDGIVSIVNFTVRENGEYKRIQLNKEEMDGLLIASIEHKDANIEKYRTVLMGQVQSATTIKEINAITWNEENSLL